MRMALRRPAMAIVAFMLAAALGCAARGQSGESPPGRGNGSGASGGALQNRLPRFRRAPGPASPTGRFQRRR